MTIRLAGDDVPLSSLVIAAFVLAVVAFAVVRIRRQELRHRPRGSRSSPSAAVIVTGSSDEAWSTEAVDPAHHLVAFLVALGQVMIDSGASVTQVDATLRRVATVNGVEDAAFVGTHRQPLLTVASSRAGRVAVNDRSRVGMTNSRPTTQPRLRPASPSRSPGRRDHPHLAEVTTFTGRSQRRS